MSGHLASLTAALWTSLDNMTVLTQASLEMDSPWSRSSPASTVTHPFATSQTTYFHNVIRVLYLGKQASVPTGGQNGTWGEASEEITGAQSREWGNSLRTGTKHTVLTARSSMLSV